MRHMYSFNAMRSIHPSHFGKSIRFEDLKCLWPGHAAHTHWHGTAPVCSTAPVTGSSRWANGGGK